MGSGFAFKNLPFVHTPVLLVFYSDFWVQRAPGAAPGGIRIDLARFLGKYKAFSVSRCVFWGKIKDFLLRGAFGVAK